MVLNYNGAGVLEHCLRSLAQQDYQPLHVIICDNASTDGSLAWAERSYPDLTVVRNAGNWGWAAGNNVGIRKALAGGAEWVWILNNDVEMPETCVSELMRFAARHPACGVLSPLIYYYEPRSAVWFAGGGFDPATFALGHSASLEAFRRQPRHRRYISGCAMLVRKDVFKAIGLIDERFFMYCEDADFGWRAGEAGFDLDIAEQAVLYHKLNECGGGGRAQSPFHAYHTLRSNLLFWRKHAGWWRFHRGWCAGHLAKWVNGLPELWAQASTRPRAEAIVDAVWYAVAGLRDAMRRPVAPRWFTRLMLKRPWLVAELMAFRFCHLARLVVGRRPPGKGAPGS